MNQKIEHTLTLDIVSPQEEDIIMADPVLLKQVAEFYNTYSDLILKIANCLNTPDAKYLIEHALDEEVSIVRAKIVGRESFYTELLRYSAEQKRRDDKAKEENENKDTPQVESQPTADEELTLESPPSTEEAKGSV